MSSITIERPTTDEVYVQGQPVVVTGIAIGDGPPEQSDIASVMISVDGGARVQAVLGPGPTIPNVFTRKFTTTAAVSDILGFYTIVAEVVFENSKSHETYVTMVRGEAGGDALTPAKSLQITATNPVYPDGGGDDWAHHIVMENQTPPISAGGVSILTLAAIHARGNDYPVCEREWNNITAPQEDYDDQPVAFSGWMLRPEMSGDDVPFTHPFGNDWECMVALDPEFTGLLAAGNARDDEPPPDPMQQALQRVQANSLRITIPPGGFMAVEQDGGCVPLGLNPLLNVIRVGDRIAALGRWIVDSGHSIPVGNPIPPLNIQPLSYRAEVHPPLIMAIAGTRVTADGQVTRLLLTSRPFLVGQMFATGTGNIQNDSATNDGGLLWHLNHEIQDLGLSKWSIEAHPKIMEKPFRGVHLLRMRVRPPAPSGGVTIEVGQIQTSFQFTARSGVGVEVVPADDGVDLVIVLNSANYTPFPLPQRLTVSITKEDLGDAGALITLEQFLELLQFNVVDTEIAENALSDGVQTDHYDLPDVDILDRSHALPFVPISNIPGGEGIIVNDGQPFPVYGWLEIRIRHVLVPDPGGPVVTVAVARDEVNPDPVGPAPPQGKANP